MKKFHWGYGLVIFFVLYIGYLIGTVLVSRTVDHSLVIDDYYALDLAYQDRYDAYSNGLLEGHRPMIEFSALSNRITIDFGDQVVRDVYGVLYRPSDKAMDRSFDLKNGDDSGDFNIDANQLAMGNWVMKVHWVDTIKNKYYLEIPLYIERP